MLNSIIFQKIKWFLGKFLNKSPTNHTKWKKLRLIFSWAIVNATAEMFNRVDLRIYLKRSFEDISLYYFFTMVHLCASHIIKSISNNLSKWTENNKIRVYTALLVRLQNWTDINKANIYFSYSSSFCLNMKLINLKIVFKNFNNKLITKLWS